MWAATLPLRWGHQQDKDWIQVIPVSWITPHLKLVYLWTQANTFLSQYELRFLSLATKKHPDKLHLSGTIFWVPSIPTNVKTTCCVLSTPSYASPSGV